MYQSRKINGKKKKRKQSTDDNVVDNKLSNVNRLSTRRDAVATIDVKKLRDLTDNADINVNLNDDSDSDSSVDNSSSQVLKRKSRKKKKKEDNGSDSNLDLDLSSDIDSIDIIKIIDEQDQYSSDDDNTVESNDEFSIEVSSSVYNQDQRTWVKVPKEVEAALKNLRDEVSSYGNTVLDGYLQDLLDNAFATNDDGSVDTSRVSLERLNDLYFIARDRAKEGDDPGLSENDETDISSFSEDLISELEELDNGAKFIDFGSAYGYRTYLMRNIDPSDHSYARFSALDANIYAKYGTKLGKVSFVKASDTTGIGQELRKYRAQAINRLELALGAVESEFSFFKKTRKKEKHTEVSNAAKRLKTALAEAKKVIDSDSPVPGEAMKLAKFDFALSTMQAAANTYFNTSQHKDRKNAAKGVLDAIDLLLAPDDKVLNSQIANAFETLDTVRHSLQKLSPKLVKEYDSILDSVVFGDTENALLAKVDDLQKLLDTVDQASLKPQKKKKGKSTFDKVKTGFEATTNVVIPPSFAPAISKGANEDDPLGSALGQNATVGSVDTALGVAIATDALKAFELIRNVKNADVRTKTDALKGAQITTSLVKNSAKIAAVTGAVAAAPVVASASIALGTGTAIQKGRTTAKTVKKYKIAADISDPSIQEELRRRLQRKGVRNLMAALGGTLALTGGVVAIVVTGGVAAPVLLAGAAVIGAGLAGDKGVNRAKKGKDVGKEREEFGRKIFVHMQKLIDGGDYEQATTIAKALTNNKLGQLEIMRGVEKQADQSAAEASLKMIQKKLKTW